MSKITFRADDDLIDRLEALDASKSEVMREALREYLDTTIEAEPARRRQDERVGEDQRSLDDIIETRLDELIRDRLNEELSHRGGQDVNVNLTIEHDTPNARETVRETRDAGETRKTPPATDADSETHECYQCGERLSSDHRYCPNCGEKASRRVFCDCGDELRIDWAFCPSCGRRTPAADVLDSS